MPTPTADIHPAAAEVTLLHERIEALTQSLVRAQAAARTARQLSSHYRARDGRPPRALGDTLAVLRHDLALATGALEAAFVELRDLDWHATHPEGAH